MGNKQALPEMSEFWLFMSNASLNRQENLLFFFGAPLYRKVSVRCYRMKWSQRLMWCRFYLYVELFILMGTPLIFVRKKKQLTDIKVSFIYYSLQQKPVVPEV